MIFGNLGNMGEFLKQAQAARGLFRKIQDELKQTRFEGESHGVAVRITGDMEVESFSVPPGIVEDGSFERLESCLKEAANKALGEAKQAVASKFKGLTGGLNIPGLF